MGKNILLHHKLSQFCIHESFFLEFPLIRYLSELLFRLELSVSSFRFDLVSLSSFVLKVLSEPKKDTFSSALTCRRI